jgi:hypothetical protein
MRKLLVLFACVLALAACGKNKDNNTDAKTGDGQQASAEDRMRQFAQCMRDHGIQMDDPQIVSGGGDPNGRSEIRASAPPGANGGADPNDEKFKKAEEECKHLMPEGGDLGKANPEAEEQMRQFAKCMRENGVENFPDPQNGGGINISPDSGINPEDPAFKETEKKCQSLAPQPSEGTQKEKRVS